MAESVARDAVLRPLMSVLSMIGWPFRRALLAGIRVYRRWISPSLPANCKYHPSCSKYAELSIRQHGVLKGLLLAVARLARCNPFSDGGVNPIPDHGRWRAPINTDGSPRDTSVALGTLGPESVQASGDSERGVPLQAQRLDQTSQLESENVSS